MIFFQTRFFRSSSPAIEALVLLLVFGTVVVVVAVDGNNDGSNNDDSSSAHPSDRWYTRYPAYPDYCSTPDVMNEKRGIPPLDDDSTVRGESRLVHVTAVIRHGARTPWSSAGDACWEGYYDDPNNIWNCDLTTFLSPPSPLKIQEEEGWTPAGSDAMFLFEKKYDALKEPLSNDLEGGTCQQGQLLLQGYEQELTNGQHLRDAYAYDGTNMDHDIRMRLLDLSDTADYPPFQEPTLMFRSDDDQRTLMSGQVLLRGLFGTEFVQHLKNTGAPPIIPLHTADRRKDILDANHAVCPRLNDLDQEIKSSQEYAKFLNSEESKAVQAYLIDNNLDQNSHIYDCMMTSICTDRAIPDALNNFDGQEGRKLQRKQGRQLHNSDDDDDNDADEDKTHLSWFQRVADWYVAKEGFSMAYNDAEYSKLALGPLWAEILDVLRPAVNQVYEPDAASSSSTEGSSTPSSLAAKNLTRLALFSGHDTTILPMLASLGYFDGKWPSYASMMILEIHELIDSRTDKSIYKSDFAFRLLYNGKILTEHIANCPQGEQMCDANILLNILEPFATRAPDCTSKLKSSSGTAPLAQSQQLVSSTGGILLVFIVLCITSAVSSLITFMCMTKRFPSWQLAPAVFRKYDSYGLELTVDGDEAPSNGDGEYQDNINGRTATAIGTTNGGTLRYGTIQKQEQQEEANQINRQQV